LLARVGEATAPALAGRVQDGQLVFTMHGLVFEGRA
jgi:hypothetical protein